MVNEGSFETITRENTSLDTGDHGYFPVKVESKTVHEDEACRFDFQK